jgi:hypothetical protein
MPSETMWVMDPCYKPLMTRATVVESPMSCPFRDWSASYFAGYWAMQARVHQAFYTVKSKCWKVCKNEQDTPTQRMARLHCVKQECYEPSQDADRQHAQAAGITYEQMQTPLLMRAAYNGFVPRFIVMLRNPVDRCAVPHSPNSMPGTRRVWSTPKSVYFHLSQHQACPFAEIS